MFRTEPYEIKLVVGMYGIAVTDIDDPTGIVEEHIALSGIEEWFDQWINKDQTIEEGTWHIKGTFKANEYDCVYVADYVMPV